MKKLLTTALSLLGMAAAASAADRIEAGFKTEPYTIQKWEGDYLPIHDKDLSKYDFIWVKYRDCDATMRFALRYSEFLRVGENGVVFDECYSTLAKGSGVAGIRLDHTTKMVNGYKRSEAEEGRFIGDTYSKHGNEVFIQAQELTHVTIEGVYAGTAEEYYAALTGGEKFEELDLSKLDDGTGVAEADGTYTYTIKAPFTDLVNLYWGEKDFSEYDYVAVELGRPSPSYMQSQMQYDGGASATSMGVSKDNMRMVVPLDKEKARKSSQFFIQSGKGGIEVNVARILLIKKQ